MKAWFRRNRDYALHELSGLEATDPNGMIAQAVSNSMTQESIEGWYRDPTYL
jgi:hypothetical protein